jgi:hypothetical protein
MRSLFTQDDIPWDHNGKSALVAAGMVGLILVGLVVVWLDGPDEPGVRLGRFVYENGAVTNEWTSSNSFPFLQRIRVDSPEKHPYYPDSVYWDHYAGTLDRDGRLHGYWSGSITKMTYEPGWGRHRLQMDPEYDYDPPKDDWYGDIVDMSSWWWHGEQISQAEFLRRLGDHYLAIYGDETIEPISIPRPPLNR